MKNEMLITNHGRVLAHLLTHPDARARDISAAAGITERAAYRIIGELCAAGHLMRRREGRRSRYDAFTQTAVLVAYLVGVR